jgi:peptidoglycan/xylan/chitin deacetylase (PgdA/CDA1 family)
MSRRGRTAQRPHASLSLDADNLWAYQMIHGDNGWDRFPTYLDRLTDVVLPALAERDMTITFFVVGQDAALAVNRLAITRLVEAGHEIGNHSFRHQPWMHRYTIEELHIELERTEEALGAITGERPVGFRGPGYSVSPDVLRVLSDRGYHYDCSTLPTIVGPLARRYYFRSAELSAEQRAERAHLFGSARDGLRRLKPYLWDLGDTTLLEIPVTTMPFTRVPMHLSYVLHLATISPELGFRYFAGALRLCRLAGVEPSILVHPLDVLGADDVDSLRFFPAMTMTGAAKQVIVGRCLDELAHQFTVLPLREHAATIRSSNRLPTKPATTTALSLDRAT